MNKDVSPDPAYIIPKYSTISPLDGVLVKTIAVTSVYLPFNEDSLAVNNYTNLFQQGWILVSNNDAQSVAQITTAFQAQSKEVVYILLLRNDVWHIYAPSNDANIDASIPRLSNVNRYEDYWVNFR